MTPEQVVALLALLADLSIQVRQQQARIVELEQALAALKMTEDSDLGGIA